MEMELFLTGLSHRTAPVGVRELLAFGSPMIEEALDELVSLEHVRAAVILCTCNRTEVYGVSEDVSEGCEETARWLGEKAGADLRAYLYSKAGPEALKHLFSVAASLDSLVLGETQILGQAKAAFALARQRGAVEARLERAFGHAFRTAKRVRSETKVGENPVSVATVAVEVARRLFGTLDGRSVMLVGAGKMSEQAARSLSKTGVSRFLVANRSLGRAEALARRLEGEARSLGDVPALLASVDIVLTSTDAPGYLIESEQVRRAMPARKERPLFFMDLSMPRDVDPSIADIRNAHSYDLDDLERVASENRRRRAGEAERALAILDLEVARAVDEQRSRAMLPIVTTLRRRASRTAEEEAERTWSRLEALGAGDEARESVYAMARAIVNKVLHEPTAALKSAPEAERESLTRAAGVLFGIHDEPKDVAVEHPEEDGASKEAETGSRSTCAEEGDGRKLAGEQDRCGKSGEARVSVSDWGEGRGKAS